MSFLPEKFRGEFGGKPENKIEIRRKELREVFSELEIEVKGKKIVFSPKEIEKLFKVLIEKRYTPETLSQIIPERFRKNVENLGIEPEKWKKMCIKNHNLLIRFPETLKKNIEGSTQRLGLSEEESLELALKDPFCLTVSPETLETNFNLLNRLFFKDEVKTREKIKTDISDLLHSPERFFSFYILNKVTGKERFSFSKNPAKLIEHYFLKKNQPQEAKNWKRNFQKFEGYFKVKKRAIEKIPSPKTEVYQKIAEIIENYVEKKSEPLIPEDLQENIIKLIEKRIFLK